tara:strand:- start:20 stop:133 length:114 start_codon:yes stop_codon:yes gene_type:complete
MENKYIIFLLLDKTMLKAEIKLPLIDKDNLGQIIFFC